VEVPKDAIFEIRHDQLAIKEVPTPVEVITERIMKTTVNVPMECPVERIIEVMVDRIVEKVVTRVVENVVTVPVDKIVKIQKFVPVYRTVERQVEVPFEQVVIRKVEVPYDRQVERAVEVPIEELIEKRVEVPFDTIVDKIVHVPRDVVVEKIVEIEVDEEVVEVPVIEETSHVSNQIRRITLQDQGYRRGNYHVDNTPNDCLVSTDIAPPPPTVFLPPSRFLRRQDEPIFVDQQVPLEYRSASPSRLHPQDIRYATGRPVGSVVRAALYDQSPTAATVQDRRLHRTASPSSRRLFEEEQDYYNNNIRNLRVAPSSPTRRHPSREKSQFSTSTVADTRTTRKRLEDFIGERQNNRTPEKRRVPAPKRR
jgi:hypothetical protein